VVPVVGGMAVIGAILLATWGLAAYVSRGGAESSERLAPSLLPVGNVESVADEVAEKGPILFQGLNTTRGERSLVLDHEGGDPTQGWRLYAAHPADREPSCSIEQVRGTSRFTDCEGREVGLEDLALPDEDIRPVVEDRTALSIDLRGATVATAP
jgi:hypothetical protein